MTTVSGTSSSTTTSAATSSSSTFGTNFNTFLGMLTTQLKNQDPLSPMDSTQFTNQLVQFSSVEQQINANTNLQTLISLQKTGQTSQAISYLGQSVEMSSSQLPLQGTSAAFSYTLPKEAKSCQIAIKNSSGTTVYSTTGDTTAGRHDIQWDGTNAAGKAQDDGLYTVTVTATATDGTSMSPTTTTYGTVNRVTNDATNGATLEIDAGSKGAKMTVTPDKILSVHSDNTLESAQLVAAQAQYQAAVAQYKALLAAQESASSSSTSSTSSTAAK
jgi:flagellar basal-body rod modification protein FlgD